jgi:alkaline phosphatase D
MGRLILAVLLAVAASRPPARAVELDPDRPIRRIVAGSCIRQDRPQPIWKAVADFAPDVLLLLGDNVYGDTEDMAVLREKYGRLAANDGFAAVRAKTPLVAVWDDHDYGANDAGREYPRRRESQQAFLDFCGVAADAPLRKQAGIYRALTVGPPGRRVQFICLDTRYHRSALATLPLAQRIKGKGHYTPTDDPQQAVLGEEQWTWLAAVLREPAEVRIVLSSIQVAATEHHHEHWGNFPRERARLFATFRDSAARGLVVVSGDRHSAEISRVPAGDDALAYPLYDLTASSLNQGKGGGGDEPNRHRVGRRYGDVNFGTIDIDWGGAAAEPRITLAVRDERGAVVSSAGLPLVELVP